ncbi:acyltransferase family protein [Alloscardovia omnicolens]|uniref:acyltransferase family protein n=1 Tax=Alloscardovia omnicolens TaxID=419015 RepID=UPI00254A6035|nr:acyltransferase family protein [Alloscardovia omnicolens]MDK6249842.1 acyltransferase family protein [Alloscardovia omnicolens]
MTEHQPKVRNLALEGLRGFAILLIILYHFNEHLMPGGFVGVEIFFVLTGFLITRSLLPTAPAAPAPKDPVPAQPLSKKAAKKQKKALRRSHNQPPAPPVSPQKAPTYSSYISKRFVRIYPLMLTVAGVSVVAAYLLNKDALVAAKKSALWVFTSSFNWYSILNNGDYFAASSPEIFHHLWFVSLIVQMYIIIPLVVLAAKALDKKSSKTTRFAGITLTAIFAIASATEMAALFQTTTDASDVSRLYYGTDTHSFGVFLGMCLAFALAKKVKTHSALSIAAFTAFSYLTIVAFTQKEGLFTFSGGLFLVGVAVAIIIADAQSDSSWMKPMLAWKPLTVLGKYSYGLYLWHWPIYVLMKSSVHISKPISDWLVPYASFALAALLTLGTFYLIEKPLKSLKVAKKSGALIARIVVAIILVLSSVSASAVILPQAPDCTQLEQQLYDATQKLAEQNRKNALERKKRAKEAKEQFAMPSGDNITGIGDSVMLGASAALNDRFPGITIDAAVSRHSSTGVGIINTMKAAGTLKKYVIIALTTNGLATLDEFQQMSDALGPDHVMILVNAHADRSWIAGSNQNVTTFAQEHPDSALVVNWDAAATAHPEVLGPDGIHTTPDGGGSLYAQTIADALQDWLNQQIAKKVNAG